MTYFLENFDLTSNAINVGLILNLILLQYLDCHFLLRNSVNAQLDFPKSSFSQRLINQKVRYLSQLPLPLLPRGSCAPWIRLHSQYELFECLLLFLQIRQLVSLIRLDTARLVCIIALPCHTATLFPGLVRLLVIYYVEIVSSAGIIIVLMELDGIAIFSIVWEDRVGCCTSLEHQGFGVLLAFSVTCLVTWLACFIKTLVWSQVRDGKLVQIYKVLLLNRAIWSI